MRKALLDLAAAVLFVVVAVAFAVLFASPAHWP